MSVYCNGLIDEDEMFDENGRLISVKSQQELVAQGEDETFDENNQPTIFFSTITPTRRIVSKMMEWEVQQDDQGLFFIYGTTSDILDDELLVVNSDNKVIWQSEIRSLPVNSFKLMNVDCDQIYITKKVLRASDMPKNEAPYGIKLKSDEEYLTYLKVSNLSNFNEEDKVYDAFGTLDVLKHEASEDTLVEPIIEEFSTTDTLEINSTSINDLSIYSNTQQEEVNWDDSEGEMSSLANELIDKSSNLERLEMVDIKSYLISQMLAYAPINIDYRLWDDKIDIKQSVVIEKIGNYFTVVVTGFGDTPIQLLDGDEIYFKVDLSVEEFLGKIQKRICRMYGLSTNEFNQIDKILVIDELENINGNFMNEGIRIYTRSRLLSTLGNMNEYVLVDLTYRALQITHKDESNNVLSIVNEALGLNQGTHVLEQISSIIRGIQVKPILYTGLFIDDSISMLVGHEMNNQNIISLSKYVSSIS